MASASVLSVSSTGTSVSTAASASSRAKASPAGPRSPTTIREGWRLSWSARPSRRNSGEKSTRSVPSRSRSAAVNPTGTVDFMTAVARGSISRMSATTCSTLLVSKKFVRSS